MTTFLRLLAQADKATALKSACFRFRAGEADAERFEVAATAFDAVPGKPFAYWVSEAVRGVFGASQKFESNGRVACSGGHSSNDERWLRVSWEINRKPASNSIWVPYAKGGAFAKFYADIYLHLHWEPERQTYFGFFGRIGRANIKPESVEHYFRPGLTWPRRSQRGLSLRAMPVDCIFADKGPAAFVSNNEPIELLALLAMSNSQAFGLLVSLQMAFGSYEVGVIQKTPVPDLTADQQQQLATLARRAWSLKRTLDTIHETSHAFELPAALRQAQGERAIDRVTEKAIERVTERVTEQVTERVTERVIEQGADVLAFDRAVDCVADERSAVGPQADRLTAYNPPAIQAELAQIQAEIDALAFDLYGFSEADRQQAQGNSAASAAAAAAAADEQAAEEAVEAEDDSAEDAEPAAPATDALLSWAVGVAFGRFDWRLATGERPMPLEPEPFEALPAKSPGMLPDGAQPFHAHSGMLVDDPGHAHDLAHQVEEVLHRVGEQVPDGVRRWLQRDFFAFHLQRYSKSRRKAPIYWPLTTASGSYTLWLYAPSLGHETLFTAVNDFLDGPSGKLTQVSRDAATLQSLGSSRTREQEKQFEALQALELELLDLRALALKIAQTYQPHPDDGIQISAAPLWPLFGHKPWQKLLKDTWTKMEKGDYDWAHLAMAYWPDRVRQKCQTDKSLAIAHGLESLYIEPEAGPKKARARKMKVA